MREKKSNEMTIFTHQISSSSGRDHLTLRPPGLNTTNDTDDHDVHVHLTHHAAFGREKEVQANRESEKKMYETVFDGRKTKKIFLKISLFFSCLKFIPPLIVVTQIRPDDHHLVDVTSKILKGGEEGMRS